MHPELAAQMVDFFAAVLLLVCFAMLSQRRIARLVNLYATQGAALALAAGFVAHTSGRSALYWAAAITLVLKVFVLPRILRRLMRRLHPRGEVGTLINAPAIMLIGLALVVLAFNVALPVAELSGAIARGTLGIALACVLLSFLMMITRAQALPQVVGFLSMENSLYFAATAVSYGMPMVLELGIALDVLIAMIILGVFVFHVRERFDAVDFAADERSGRE